MGLLGSIFIFSLPILLLISKPPSLNEKDTKGKIEEILKAHASYHTLNKELMKRSFQNYIEELDPLKMYFLEQEVEQWINPSEALLEKAYSDYLNEKFTVFEAVHEQMVQAIERRQNFEKQIDKAELPQGVKFSEFKNLNYAKEEGELYLRLLKARSLQIDTGKKLDPNALETFVQRIHKRRLSHEQDILGHSAKERKQIALAYTLKALASSLDSQTNYFTPSEANQFMIRVQQRLFGIGAQLRDAINGLSIVRIMENSPASKSNKLHIGDKIIAVDEQSIVGMDISEAIELIRGQEGTTVSLTILREDKEKGAETEEKLTVDITRGEIVIQETRLETLKEPFGDGVIGIFQLHSFYQDAKTSSSQDLALALEEMKKEHKVKGVILDLRNNAGGLLNQAVAVSGLFISKGIVVSIKESSGQIHHLRNIDGCICWDGPLIILTNRASASSAEIVAQTLQDYGRALVVGDQETYGKGTFQIFTLESSNFAKINPKGEYKVTRGRYYTVSGKSPQLVGVKADIVVPGILANLEIGEKYSKYPLESDAIEPAFDDKLDDIPSYQRAQIAKLYKFNLQTIITSNKPFIPILQENSKARQSMSKSYSSFLKKIENLDPDKEEEDFLKTGDLQLHETINVMKDFILLESIQNKKAS